MRKRGQCFREASSTGVETQQRHQKRRHRLVCAQDVRIKGSKNGQFRDNKGHHTALFLNLVSPVLKPGNFFSYQPFQRHSRLVHG